MTNPITIESVGLEGFRAYLQHQSFPFSRGTTPLSLAVFAPNAKGKSSLVDAFEYYFSEDATLSRLGIRAVDRRAGRSALEHVDAKANDITPGVRISFRQGTDRFEDRRPVMPQGAPLTDAGRRVLEHTVLPFIIRGHELRGFVENQTSEQRYEEIVGWFGLAPLLEIQKNLRALRRQVKNQSESTAQRDERLRDLSRITSGNLTQWDDTTVCHWFNDEVLAKLDKELRLQSPSRADRGYQELTARKQAEDERVGLTSLKQILGHIETVHQFRKEDDQKPSGTIPAFENAVITYNEAKQREEQERAKAAETVFKETWEKAKALFENDDLTLDSCPVCDTNLLQTSHGSREAVRTELSTKLENLADYQQAELALKTAEQTLTSTKNALTTSLGNIKTALTDTPYANRTKSLSQYEDALRQWEPGHPLPDGANLVSELQSLYNQVSADKKEIEDHQGENTYTNALSVVNQLIDLKHALARIDRIRAELAKLNQELNDQVQAINKAIVNHTQNLIGRLKDNVNQLYKDILGQDDNAPPIYLSLPGEDETNQQRVQLLIDFAENCKGVIPSGYLSDSQLHSLALALRLAAIRLFNMAVPFIVLDDVVTSYDADNRANIAQMLAKHFTDHQILLVTHDERFFQLLQDRLPQQTWRYRRVTELAPDFGPRFHDHRTPDEEIEEKLDRGERAANLIRQAEEEWLEDTCRDFRVKVTIRPLNKPYEYDRSELAKALASFMKEAKIKVPEVSGVANPFLNSLQKGDIENFGSHFSNDPNASASVGDDRARWREFTEFRERFICSGCGRNRFMRPDPLDKPVCKNCQTPFAFSESPGAQ